MQSKTLELSKLQPVELYTLSFAEMWDRFSYYGIQALLVLYVTKVFLFSDSKAYELYGAFTALTFATTIIGGYIADRLLGFRQAVIIGALLMILSNIILIFPGEQSMYIALAIMICGIGLFKPNNASLLGTLYEKNDIRRESGFSIFYIGMNAGALLGPLVYGYVSLHFGWHYGFLISAVGMLISLLVFLSKENTEINHNDQVDTKNCMKLRLTLRQITYIGILVAVSIFTALMHYVHIFNSLLGILGIISIILLLFTASKFQVDEKNRLIALSILSFFCIFFFACSLQTATSLTLFIDRDIHRTILGLQLPTMVFLSLEPFFIILTAPLIANVWIWFNRRGHVFAPSSKIIIGITLAAISFALFSLSAYTNKYQHISLCLLVIGNLVLGLGELCVLPVAISAITQFSPHKMRGTMMGVLFLALAFSGYLAGAIAKIISAKNTIQGSSLELTDYAHAFIDVFYITMLVSILMFFMNPWLKKLLNSN